MRTVKDAADYKNGATYSAVKWAARNPEKVREYNRRWKQKNTDRIRAYSWERDNQNILRRLLISAKARAAKLGLPFDIGAEDIVVPEVCPVFGTAFTRTQNKWSATAPSLDRIDSTKGYVRGNVQIISALANRMKSNASREQLVSFSKWIAAQEGL